jgi:hypothetical protein
MLLHTTRLRRCKRGVSNVIVVMLSLVLVTIVVSNVILWSYQMNEFDLERNHEDLKITEAAPVNTSAWFTAQNEYTVDTGTRVYGTYANTQSIDGIYESFTEGLNWWNANYAYRRRITVTNNGASTLNANYTLTVTVDTNSLIASGKAMASGNDIRVVFWSGNNWTELNRDIAGLNTTSTQISFETQATILGSAQDSNYYLFYGNPNAGNPPANESNVYLWFDDFNRPDNPNITTEAAYAVKTGGGSWSLENGTLKNVGNSGDPNKLLIASVGVVGTGVDMLVKIKVASFASGDPSRMGLSAFMDSSPSRGSGYCGLLHNDQNSVDLLNDLRSWGSHASYSWSLNTWYYMRFRVVDPSSKLGKVKLWPVGTSEPSSWTLDGNFGGGAPRSYGEIGFAGSRTSDTTYFDDITIREAAVSEPSTSIGTEETQVNNRLELDGNFRIDLSTYPLSRINSLEVQLLYRSSDPGEKWYIKAYDWTASAYSDNGFNYTLGDLPTTTWEYYSVNLTNQWSGYVSGNGTVNIKVSDYGIDQSKTTIDIDFLAVRADITGTVFVFQNSGSVTAHLVSLWIDNSTLHQRYDLNLYVNSGDIVSYVKFDLNLPEKPFIIKIVTERGNTAVFP